MDVQKFSEALNKVKHGWRSNKYDAYQVQSSLLFKPLEVTGRNDGF
ncbi:hypothetical protein [uncultured Methanomethylovorans sp.]|nr:hypothetical protein [uncultured Methanomethylovorans sp.]